VALLGELSEFLQHRLPVPVVRVCYRVAYRLARVWWYVVRPDVHGVKGVLRDGDRILLVRHTYGDRQRWDIPGGHAHAGEPAAAAVRREMEH
jgi:8-oxo-dGTP pyrophosphatase MutT (NUDIX family)